MHRAASNASSNWADTGNTAALAQSAMIDRLSTPIVREMGGRPINETSLTKLDKILATGPSNTIRSCCVLFFFECVALVFTPCACG